jgi:hypothetical protein
LRLHIAFFIQAGIHSDGALSHWENKSRSRCSQNQDGMKGAHPKAGAILPNMVPHEAVKETRLGVLHLPDQRLLQQLLKSGRLSAGRQDAPPGRD